MSNASLDVNRKIDKKEKEEILNKNMYIMQNSKVYFNK